MNKLLASFLVMLWATWAILLNSGQVHAQAGLTIDNYTLVSSRRVTRTTSDFTYRAVLTNPVSDGFTGVVGLLSSNSPNTVVIDGTLSFGDVPGVVKATSLDTFTIRQNLAVPFNPADLVWAVGVRLGGSDNMLARDALQDYLAEPAVPGDIDEAGFILTRIGVHLASDSTVGQINAALDKVGGQIAGMARNLPAISVAVPRQATVHDLRQLAGMLNATPGIISASVGSTVSTEILPPPPGTEVVKRFVMEHLLAARFPAAWNMAGTGQRLLQGCKRVPIFIQDTFGSPRDAEFFREVPTFPLFIGDSSTESHGFDVTTVLAARFDQGPLTGANPFLECLDLRPLAVNRRNPEEAMAQFSSQVNLIEPGSTSGVDKAIFSQSIGFKSGCELLFLCTPQNIRSLSPIVRPIERLRFGLGWKKATYKRWDDFLVIVAAGNHRHDPSTLENPLSRFYPGLGTAHQNLFTSVATNSDPFLFATTSSGLWGPDPTLGYPALGADEPTDANEFAKLKSEAAASGLNQVTGASNVLLVGGTTNGRDYRFLEEMSVSNTDPDVLAVGQCIEVSSLLEPCVDGTSFASPQVAGLAAYLWLLSPELRSLPAARTANAIFFNAREKGVPPFETKVPFFLDAYAAVLSLDKAAAPSPGNSPLRLALLDANGDGKFDTADLNVFLDQYFTRDQSGQLTQTQKTPVLQDYSRYDLNGDGFTGGFSRARFDLDRIGSLQFADTKYSTVTNDALTDPFNEAELTDLQILCYYAYSGLYTGAETQRDQFLGTRCGKKTSGLVTLHISAKILSGGVIVTTRTFTQFGHSDEVLNPTGDLNLEAIWGPSDVLDLGDGTYTVKVQFRQFKVGPTNMFLDDRFHQFNANIKCCQNEQLQLTIPNQSNSSLSIGGSLFLSFGVGDGNLGEILSGNAAFEVIYFPLQLVPITFSIATREAISPVFPLNIVSRSALTNPMSSTSQRFLEKVRITPEQ